MSAYTARPTGEALPRREDEGRRRRRARHGRARDRGAKAAGNGASLRVAPEGSLMIAAIYARKSTDEGERSEDARGE